MAVGVATPDPFDNFRRMQEALRRLTESPALKALQQNQETLRRLTDWPALKAQQETLRRLTESPALKALQQNQETLRRLTESPALKAHQETLRRLMESPAFEALQQNQETLRRLTESPALKAQQEALRRLTESPAFEALEQQHVRWRDVVPPSLVEAVEKYESELYEELADAARTAADSIAEEAEAGAEPAVSAMWFGFESRQILIWRMEGLLKTMEALAAFTVGAGEATDNPIPAVLVALIAMLAATAELFIYFGKEPPPQRGEHGSS